MTPASGTSIQTLRLVLKRAFTAYFLALSAPGIADPTAAFASSEAYLAALLSQFGPQEFMHRLDDETTRLVGEVEQDLRHRFRGREDRLDYADLEDRLRECFEYALGRLDTAHTRRG